MKTTEDRKFLSLTIPKDTLIPMFSYYKNPPTYGRGDFELWNIMAWVMNGSVLHYPCNRGLGEHSEITTRDCRLGIKSNIIGEVTIGYYSNEDYYGHNKEQLHFNGFHSRMLGFLHRYLDGNMTDSELKTVISVRVCGSTKDAFLEAYRDMGRPGSEHRIRHRVWNADQAYGEHLSTIKEAVGPGISNRFEKFATIFSSILDAMSHEYVKEQVNWNWSSIYLRRSKTAKMSNEPAGSVVISSEQMARLIRSVQFWFDLIVAIEQVAGTVNVSKIVTSAGFFGLCVTDHYSKEDNFPQNHKLTAERIVNNFGQMQLLVTSLCRATQGEIANGVSQIFEIIRKKVKKPKMVGV